jgi:hypothetical protein
MEFDKEIVCTDRKGNQHYFKYSIEESDDEGFLKWIFKVLPFDLNAPDWYEFSITVIRPGIGKVTLMDNRNMPQYRGKGITERLIEESANFLGLTIISSTCNPNKKVLSTEFRTIPATKVWEKLKNQGLASYNEEDDIYTFLIQEGNK